MNRLITLLLLLLCSIVGNSQSPIPNPAYYVWKNGARFEKELTLPNDTLPAAAVGSKAFKGNKEWTKKAIGFWEQSGGVDSSTLANYPTFTQADSIAKKVANDSIPGLQRVLLKDSSAQKGMNITMPYPGPAITMNSSTDAAFSSYKRSGGQPNIGGVVVDVGMLGNPEANLSYNMRYINSFHSLYDQSKGAQWLALHGLGGALQYCGPYGGPLDCWQASGYPYAMYWKLSPSLTPGASFSQLAINVAAGYDAGDNTTMINRIPGKASLSGVSDLVLNGHRNYNTAGTVYTNAGNTGDTWLSFGVPGGGAGKTRTGGDLQVGGNVTSKIRIKDSSLIIYDTITTSAQHEKFAMYAGQPGSGAAAGFTMNIDRTATIGDMVTAVASSPGVYPIRNRQAFNGTQTQYGNIVSTDTVKSPVYTGGKFNLTTSWRVIKDGSASALESGAWVNAAENRGWGFQLTDGANPGLALYGTNGSNTFNKAFQVEPSGVINSAGNFAANYTARSYVDKNYVDSTANRRISDSIPTLDRVAKKGDSTDSRIVTSKFFKADSVRTNSEISKYLLQVGDTAFRTNDTAYFYGNSIYQGVGASSAYYNWVSTFSRLTGITPINRGLSGTTMQFISGTSLDSAFENRINGLPTWRSTFRFIFLGYGTNDSRNALYDTTTFKAVLNRGIDTLLARLWTADKIVITSLIYWNDGLAATLGARRMDYYNAARNVALARGLRFVDIYNPVRVTSAASLTADSLHPNNYGHLLIANTGIQSLLQPTQGLLQVNGKANFIDNITVGGQMPFAPTSYPAAINTGSSYGNLPTDYKLYLLGLNGGIGVTSAGVNYGITNTSTNRHTFYGTGGLYVQDGNLFIRPVTGNVSSATPGQLNLGTTFANTPNDDTKMKVFMFGGTGLGVSSAGFEFFSQVNNPFIFRRAKIVAARVPESDSGYIAGAGLSGPMARPAFINLRQSYSDEPGRPSKSKLILYGSTDGETIGAGVSTTRGLELYGGTGGPNIITMYSTLRYNAAPVAIPATDTTFMVMRLADSTVRIVGKTQLLSMLGVSPSGADTNYVKTTGTQNVYGKKTYKDSLKADAVIYSTGEIATTKSVNAAQTITAQIAVQAAQILATGASGEFFITNAGNGVAIRNTPGTPTSKVYQDLQINKAGTIALTTNIGDSMLYTGRTVLVTSASYTASVDVLTIWINYTGGTHSLTFPSAASNPNKRYIIKNLSLSNNVTLTNIASGETASLNPRGFITVASDGTDWFQIQ